MFLAVDSGLLLTTSLERTHAVRFDRDIANKLFILCIPSSNTELRNAVHTLFAKYAKETITVQSVRIPIPNFSLAMHLLGFILYD